MKKIGIVTLQGDLHALGTQWALKKHFDVECHIFEMDRISGRCAIDWNLSRDASAGSFIRDSDDEPIDIESIDVLWWRRGTKKQQLAESMNPIDVDLIEADSAAAWQGAFMSSHRGKWVSHPLASALAENKLIQLRAARDSGFRMPDTLVSQDPLSIRRFFDHHRGQVIVKPVEGSRHSLIYTNILTERELSQPLNLSLCPAIYQELIPGTKHLRVAAFGEEIYTSLIETEVLDWRSSEQKSISPFLLDEINSANIRKVCKRLDLAMGIFDLKLSETGEVVWFEVNPQGQFLFLQVETGIDLLFNFAKFLYNTAIEI